MKKLGWVVVGLFCLLLLGMFFFNGVPGSNYWRAKRFSTAIAQELPLGSSRSQTLAFLKKEKIEHSYIDSDFELLSVVEKAGLKPSQLGGVALSMFRQTTWAFPFSVDTQFVFFFDKKNKLIKVSQWEIATGF